MSPQFPLPLDEYARRWREARLAVLGVRGDYGKKESEAEYLSHVPLVEQAEILSRVYVDSQRFGKRIAETLGRSLILSEVIDILSGSGIACFSGHWKKESAALSRYLYRGECANVPALFFCDYWRECARGLVSGLGTEIQYSRHRSLGHGSSSCLDYVFVNPGVDRKLGVVPRTLKTALEPLRRSLSQRRISIDWDGFCEDTLYYHADHNTIPLDDEERTLVAEELSTETQRRFPQVKCSEVSHSLNPSP